MVTTVTTLTVKLMVKPVTTAAMAWRVLRLRLGGGRHRRAYVEGNCEYSNHRGQRKRGGPPAWGFGERLTTAHRKNQNLADCYTEPSEWCDGQGM